MVLKRKILNRVREVQILEQHMYVGADGGCAGNVAINMLHALEFMKNLTT